MKTPAPRQPRRRAFTLIELLVVIAIIAVLAALAFPVIGRMQRNGQTATSTSNLRQLHTMVMSYVGDHNGVFPRARYDADSDPNGNNDGIPHYWRRVVWESVNGPLGNTYEEKVSNLTKGSYAKAMWCPLQVSEHGMSKTGFLEGHGSYAINKFFFLWDDRTDRRPIQENVRGKVEPFIVAGTSNGDLGTYAYFESVAPPSDGTYDKPPWHNMAYDYGGSGNNGLAIYVGGNVALITPEQGKEIAPAVSNDTNFE